jgi:hypothetical protein
MLKIFYVRHEDDDGNNLDLFVEAATPEQAAEIWALYYCPVDDREDDEEFVPEYIYLIEPTGTAGAIVWNVVGGTKKAEI